MTAQQQAEEALRRAQAAPTMAVRGLLRAVAQRLRAERPTDPMRDTMIDALALTYSERRYGIGSVLAEDAERQFLALAPRITRDRPTTRGEYALILDRIAAGSAL
ncbi:hypothetical protein [Streptomyces goshikiensis]